MTTPEGTIKGKLDRRLKALKPLGLWYYSPQSGPHGASGIPDRVLCVAGKFVGIECKRDATHKLTPLQLKQKEWIEQAGGVYFIVYDAQTIDETVQWIASHMKEKALYASTEGSEGPHF